MILAPLVDLKFLAEFAPGEAGTPEADGEGGGLVHGGLLQAFR